jgi:hypothetical protein
VIANSCGIACYRGQVPDWLEILLRVFSFAVGSLLVLGTFLSAVKTVVVPRAVSLRITRFAFIVSRKLFERLAHEGRPYKERDRLLAVNAPLTFVMLPLIWVTLTIIGFAGIQWGIAGGSLRDAFLVSGSSMLTLGVLFRRSIPAATFSYLQAAIGLILVALLISYLPTIYSAFSRRETLVGMLESRAGLPPSPFEMLLRFNRIGALDTIGDDLFGRWEEWFIEVEESHTSFAALVFFRSPHPERSWITAAGCVLDTAAIYLSVVDRPFSPKAALALRSGFLCLRRIAVYFGLPVDLDPAPTDPISVTRQEFDLMLHELDAGGIPLKANHEQAWADFQGWRVNYDKALVSIAHMIIAPEGRWSSDRPGQRMVPRRTGAAKAAKLSRRHRRRRK